MCKTAAV